MAQILVRASNPGHKGRYRAGDRHWLNGQEYMLEIVDDPEGGPPLKAAEPIDPATGLSDMTRISKAGVAELKTDPHISTLEGDNAVTSAQAAAAVGRVRQLAADLEQAKLAEAMALEEVAELTKQLGEAKAEIEKLQVKAATATAQAATLQAENAALKAEAAKVAKKGRAGDKGEDAKAGEAGGAAETPKP